MKYDRQVRFDLRGLVCRDCQHRTRQRWPGKVRWTLDEFRQWSQMLCTPCLAAMLDVAQLELAALGPGPSPAGEVLVAEILIGDRP